MAAVEADTFPRVGDALEDGRRMVRLELAMQLLQPRCRLVESAPGEDVREGCLHRLGAWPRVLRHVAERAAAQHQPSLGVVLAAEHLQEARLARPAAADEPDLVAGGP